MADYVVKDIRPTIEGSNDVPYWMGCSSGKFNVRSAYQLLRHRIDPVEWTKNLWVKGLPYKISFFLWSVFKRRIPTDDILRRMEILIVSRCYCCDTGTAETINHLLLTAPIAFRLWK